MTSYDLCLAWNWKYDAGFVGLLEKVCEDRGLTLMQITPDNLEIAYRCLLRGQIAFCAYIDRASDSDPRFLCIDYWAREHEASRLNPNERARRAWDKAAMHGTISTSLHTPPTIILPSFADCPHLPAIDLSLFSGRFSIKPAHGGGGEGVVIDACSLETILAARQENPADRYLLQAHIVPFQLGIRPAWFRVIYCRGHVMACWWDLDTHEYSLISTEEMERHSLAPLISISTMIARHCQLDIFSSEIVLTGDGRFMVVDYVNDPLDLRLSSQAIDGVPDAIVHIIIDHMVQFALTAAAEQAWRCRTPA